MKFKDVLARFAEVTEEPDDGYLALCPAHGDSTPSLRIWRGDDNKVRITCRTGCAPADVIGAVGLEWSDLFNSEGDGNTVPAEKRAMVGTGHIASLAMYADFCRERLSEDDDWSARAREYLAKRFGMDVALAEELGIGVDDCTVNPLFPYLSLSYRAFARLTVPLNDFAGVPRGLQGRDLTGDCPGRWVSLKNPKGHRWAPYGVFHGSGGYGATLITEGPGDGLTAVAVGYDVVMVRGASLAASPELIEELAEGLRGTQVIIAGDNDKAGNGFTRRIAEGLAAHGIEAFALTIPVAGWDLTKWQEERPDTFPALLHSAVRNAAPVRKHAEAVADAVSSDLAERTGADTVSVDQGTEAARVLAGVLERYGDTDAMNAHALVAWANGCIKYAPGLGYHVWNGRTWERSEVKVRQEIHRMGAALVLAGKVKEARGFTMTTRINDLMTELRSVPSVHVAASDFDAKPDLLAFRNVTVNLRTGEAAPHDKRNMLTYALDLDYDASATCPRWESFMEEIFPGLPDLPGYMQRLIGYGITGHVSEQAFTVLWGKGANGKSVMTDVLTGVFRPITKTTPFATFEEKANGGIPNDIAALRGSRLVMASEGESGRPMSEAILKRVTGDEMISARFLRQEFFEFKPQFLLFLATNHKPKFRGQDDGLWRRVKLIPFRRFFAPHERDYGLNKKLIGEAAGIAAWCVAGAVAWAAGGLNDPAEVREATTEYKETSDTLAGFFPGIIVADDSSQMDGAEAFNAYLDWCEAENLPARERWTRKAFYSAMEERSITRKRIAKGMALVGIRLADVPQTSGHGIFGKG